MHDRVHIADGAGRELVTVVANHNEALLALLALPVTERVRDAVVDPNASHQSRLPLDGTEHRMMPTGVLAEHVLGRARLWARGGISVVQPGQSVDDTDPKIVAAGRDHPRDMTRSSLSCSCTARL